MTHLVVIGGCSGSGRSMLSQALVEYFTLTSAKSKKLTTHSFSLDNCYHDLRARGIGDQERDNLCFNPDFNFDCLEIVDQEKIKFFVESIFAGKPFRYQTYDFATHSYQNKEGSVKWTEVADKLDLAFFEGIFALCFEQLTSIAAHQIYLDTPPEIALINRFIRDVNERERTPEHVLKQMKLTVIPKQNELVFPGRYVYNPVTWYSHNQKMFNYLRSELGKKHSLEFPEMRLAEDLEKCSDMIDKAKFWKRMLLNHYKTKPELRERMYETVHQQAVIISQKAGCGVPEKLEPEKKDLRTVENIVNEYFLN